MPLGMVGLGSIGRPMAERLLDSGFELVVHNRSRQVVDELAERGASPAWSPREVAERTDLVLTALRYPRTVEEVYLGPDGLTAAARPGLLCVDHSTIGPDLSRRLAGVLEEAGAEFLDAPVSGGSEGARAGTLAIMVGGPPSTFERALPVLSLLGQKVARCGPHGAGSVVKLVNQLLVGIHSIAAAEAVRLAQRAGVEPALALKVIGGGLGASAILARNGPMTLRDDFQPGSRVVDLWVKDAGLVRELCDELGLELPAFLGAKRAFERVFELGGGICDLPAVIAALDDAPVWPTAPNEVAGAVEAGR